jgi:hypothetical protein
MKTNTTGSTPRVDHIISVKFADAVLDWFISLVLLFIQFRTTMYYQQQAETTDMPWFYAATGVAIFGMIYLIHPVQSLTILLLPEVCTNVILATVMFQ